MARVTLEGSVTPSTFLARGARVTVERTPYIDKLIRAGYVTVIATPPAKEEVEQIVAPQLEAAKQEEQLLTVAEAQEAPSSTALKTTWQTFLAEQGIDVPEGATKTEMIIAWNEAQSGGSGD